MTQQIYHPKISGGLTQISLDEGGTWIDLRGVTSLDSSGGEREEEEQESIDEGVSSEVGPPRPKDIAIAINPSVGAAGYQAIQDAYYSEKPVKIRFTTKARTILDIVGSGANSKQEAYAGAIAAGAGNLGELTLYDGTGQNVFNTAENGPFLSKLHRGLVLEGTISGTTHVRYYVIDSLKTAKNNRSTVLNVTTQDEKASAELFTSTSGEEATKIRLVEYGVRVRWDCNVINADVNSLSPGARFADALALKQTSAKKFIELYWNTTTRSAANGDYA